MLDNKFMVGVMLFVCDGCLVVFYGCLVVLLFLRLATIRS